MPKKHRVKRQNYVAHLRNLEKERETYLQKRRAHKRSRETGNEEVMGEARDRMEAGAPKKRRTEADASTAASARNEEGAAPHTHLSLTTSAKSAAAAETVPAKRRSFSTKSFAELVKASTATAQTTDAAPRDTSAITTTAKKTLKRRNY
ncbi:hypothetical protein conserved [Leishmania donovani]|uniref:Uncharacterized protein n=3 Tax=Leishmania donovani species complex TaxID=38574 RepID=A4I819_LEIIN|nr:conserved hypothetical protein [Leishmania infantum JPCM5]XP_003863624.1 hypothetical protein, conserved [Leishmania donovani]CAC9525515.1 hypothetical_protein_-_conserved [Leishmania infantum]AYU81755.1 hypothetical protein LdCL_320026400 [Leishmania donovani]TPP43720.1 hypothetical protein CGC21_20595 [Leishmania donovani]TPP47215.1 hypothetical protein CGC20_34350 [Leishmania donovani]CAJ1991741.1 hypothetical protein conserved [Leishmania donovani]|eukprot:XP_001467888.1 conserved hypothetical protein [Leishmania infantum JPCM5]